MTMTSSLLKVTGVIFLALEAVVVDGLVLQRASPESSKLSALPSKKSFAVVLLGERFRYSYNDLEGKRHRRGCDEHDFDFQMNCTQSVIEKIIEPLEQRGNLVDVYLTTPAAWADPQWVACSLDDKLLGALRAGSSRVVHKQGSEATEQAYTMLQVIDILNKENGGGTKVGARFDYIMIVRGDMMWYQSFDQIRIGYDDVNVVSACEKGAAKNVSSLDCVQDILWLMPGSLYAAFNSSFGRDGGLSPGMGPGADCHGCQNTIRHTLMDS